MTAVSATRAVIEGRVYEAYRRVLAHATVCKQCGTSPGQCPEGRALRLSWREAKR